MKCFHVMLVSPDARTLLRTPTVYEIRDLACQSGQYHLFGIEKGMLLTLKNLKTFTATGQLILQFKIDGLLLFKCSAVDFWPILGLIKQSGCKPIVLWQAETSRCCSVWLLAVSCHLSNCCVMIRMRNPRFYRCE
jgi:hypothetical protein